MTSTVPSVLHENIIVDIGRSIGPPLIGAFVATALWGMMCIQTSMYVVTYDLDPWYLKGLVAILWVLDTIHEVLCVNSLWQTLIPHFGDLLELSTLHPGFMWQGLIGSIVAFLARGFFVWRIWQFANKNWMFPITLILPSVGDTVATFIWAFRGVRIPSSDLASGSMHKLSLAVMIIIATTDTLIAATMCTLLWRRRTGLAAPDRLLVRLMNASANTGAWTAVFALFTVIALVAWPHDLFSLLTQFPLCPLYCNAVLANLNSRKYISATNGVFDVFSGSEYTGPSLQFGTPRRSRSGTRSEGFEMTVMSTSEGHVRHDETHTSRRGLKGTSVEARPE